MPLTIFGVIAENLAQAAERRRGDRDTTQKPKPGRAQTVLGLVIIAAIVGGGWWLVSAGSALSRECSQAFAAAASVGARYDSVSDLDPAFTACSSAREFGNGYTAHPAALRGVADIGEWLDNRCATAPALATSQVCRSR